MPMEMHMVHQSADKSLAVISLLFKEGGQNNSSFAPILITYQTLKVRKNISPTLNWMSKILFQQIIMPTTI